MSDIISRWKYNVKEDRLIEFNSIQDWHDILDMYCYGINFRKRKSPFENSVIVYRVFFDLDDIQKIESHLNPHFFRDVIIQIQKHLPSFPVSSYMINQYVTYGPEILLDGD